jgi:hypothetical protein
MRLRSSSVAPRSGDVGVVESPCRSERAYLLAAREIEQYCVGTPGSSSSKQVERQLGKYAWPRFSTWQAIDIA